MSNRQLAVGFVFCALCLLIPPLGIVALIIGIIALVRGRIAAGVVLVVLAVLLPIAGTFILEEFVVNPYRVPSSSMTPTLQPGDRILAWRAGGDPAVGDIVVFHPPQGASEGEGTCATTGGTYDPGRAGRACAKATPRRSETSFIKRVVAGPGDTLAVRDGHVIRNGRREAERFIASCGGGDGCDLPKPITIPPGAYFMMGDNRGSSFDSRFWGAVPGGWIIGRAVAVYWPTKRIGGL